MQTRFPLLIATLVGGLSAGCLPEYQTLDTSFSCEGGVETSNPYDLVWELKIKEAHVATTTDVPGVVASRGGLEQGDPLKIVATSPSGKTASTNGVDLQIPESSNGHLAKNWGILEFDDDSVLAVGTVSEFWGSDRDPDAAPITVTLQNDIGWRLFDWNGNQDARAECSFKLHPGLLVEAYNGENGRSVPLIIAETDEHRADIPEAWHAIRVPPSSTGCEWLRYAELEIVPKVDTEFIIDAVTDDAWWEPNQIFAEAGCNSFRSADAYDYEMELFELRLENDGEVQEALANGRSPVVRLSYQARSLVGEGFTDEEVLVGFWDSAAEQQENALVFYFDYPGYKLGLPMHQPLQPDHLAGKVEDKKVHFEVYQPDEDGDVASVLADCTFSLSEARLLQSVKREGDADPLGDTWEIVDYLGGRIFLNPGVELECEDGHHLHEEMALKATFNAKFKVDLMSIAEPGDMDEPFEWGEITPPDEWGATPVGEQEDWCLEPQAEGARCDCRTAYQPDPYAAFDCLQGEADEFEPPPPAETDDTEDDEEELEPAYMETEEEHAARQARYNADICCNDPDIDCAVMYMCPQIPVCNMTIQQCCDSQTGCCRPDWEVEKESCPEEEAACLGGYTTDECCGDPAHCCLETFSYDAWCKDPCEDDPCGANGTCVDDGSAQGYDCSCDQGYEKEGGTCVDIDGCDGKTCGGNGTCVDKKAPEIGWECLCDKGYEQEAGTCVDTDGCKNNPCENGATCVDVPAPEEGFTCECPEGTEGDTCTDIDSCADDPCFEGVECTDAPAPEVGYTCGGCPDGYEGDDGVNCTLIGDGGDENEGGGEGEEEEERPNTDDPNFPDDGDAPSDDLAEPAPIRACACSGSGSKSSRGTALLLLAALVLVWRRRRSSV